MVSIRRILFPGLLPSFLKVRYYRIFTGAKIGKGTKISFFSYIGKNCRIGPLTFIEIEKSLTMGDRVHISMMTNIRTGVLAIGDDSEIMDNVRVGGILTHRSVLTIGKRVGIFSYAYINPTYEIVLEDGVGIGGRCHLFTHGSWPSKLDGYPLKFAPITLKKNVWLAWRVTILPGVTVGENSILQSDVFISKDVPANSLAKGNPAKVVPLKVQDYSDEQKINIIREIYLDFREYLNFIGYQSEEFESKEDQFGFTITLKGNLKSIVYFWSKDSSEDLQNWIEKHPVKSVNLVVFSSTVFDGLSVKVQSKYNYFLTDVKKIIGTNEPWLTEVREFFKRYGITFDVDIPRNSNSKSVEK